MSRPPTCFFLTERIAEWAAVDGVIFSGGVAEYVYGTETRDFGDLGRRLGTALADRIDAGALPAPLLPAAERIRATVLGASEYTVQLSGITSFIPASRRDPAAPQPAGGQAALRHSATCVESAGAWHRRSRTTWRRSGCWTAPADIALALHWSGVPSYRRLRAFAEGVVEGLRRRVADGRPLYLMIDGDIALTLGTILRDELSVTNDLLILDGIELARLRLRRSRPVRHPSNTVPVTIKSLVFGVEQAGNRTPVAAMT